MKAAETYDIVVGIDHSEVSCLALREAQRQAALHERAVIHTLHVAPVAVTYSHGLFPISPLLADGSVSRALERLERFVAHERDEYRAETASTEVGAPEFVSHIRIANPSDDISELARGLNAQLIVVGTHGRSGLARLLLGSVARDVVASAPRQVLVVREGEARGALRPESRKTGGGSRAA
jgi:nucleotide-binding universal stress UspA family protein